MEVIYMKSIRVKILLPVIIMLTFFMIFMGGQIVQTKDNLNQIKIMNDKYYATLSSSKDLKLAVVQVQQFLTDISATRAEDGLDDGYEEAEQHALHVEEIVAQLVSINPEHEELLTKINRDFDSYYEVGKKMAAAYIKDGPKKGNLLMGDFDMEAEMINNEVDAYVIQAQEGIVNSINGIEKLIQRSIILSILSIIFYLGISILTWLFATKSIYNPINTLIKRFNELSSSGGDLTTKVEIKTGDELELLAGGINQFISNIREIVVEVKNTGENVGHSAGSLNISINENQKVLDDINKSIENIASGASEQSQDINEVSDKIQEISSSISENEKKISGINSSAGKTRTLINGGLEAVNNQNIKTNENMKAFQKVSKEVSGLAREIEEVENILSTITSISDQTNLLALNATIEAARAGEHGRGFSVVAMEVKKLSEESAIATEGIAQILQNIDRGAKESIVGINHANIISEEQKIAVDSTSNIFRDMTSEIETMIVGIEEINKSFKAIGNSTKNISDKTQDISSVSEENSAISQEVSASSEEQNAAMQGMVGAAKELDQLSIKLGEVISNFKM